MKNAIAKFLGLDKIQTETTNLFNEVVSLRDRTKALELDNAKLRNALSILEDTNWNEIARDNISLSDLAEYIDMYDLASSIDNSDVAYHIDNSDLACYIDASDIASELDMDDVMEHANINIDTLAEQVAERIADREGMQQLVSEELENHASTISTDAVESMIHTAIQQFADSLEVMVSAKLNYDK